MKCLWYMRFLIPTAMAIPGRFNRDAEAITGSIPGSQRSTFKCDTSRNFCLDEVVWAKGLDFQTLLHTYCLEQYEHAALSYHGCMRAPYPTLHCAASPGAWNSAFAYICLNE
ncbi:hypothetical protein J3E71DRAFT_239386 [Bipolaris maydis]|nr:hypothetical protein J3E71DRAFT_239386 [Bipolaris maydis]